MTPIFLIMQLTGILLLACSLTLSAKTISQTVSLSGKKIKLDKVFLEITRQTGYEVACNYDLIESAKPVTIDLKDAPVEEFLRAILKGQELTYSIEDKTIFIGSKAANPAEQLSALLNNPPPITVKGRVVNEKNEGVVASVTVKGTKKGTTTDVNGFFELNNVDDKSVLVITGTNIESVEYRINNGEGLSEFNIGVIPVKSAVNDLDSVVVNKGYYKEKQRFNTGSVAKVTAKDIERQPVTSPLMALQGRIAGVDITPNSGVAGSAIKIVIRGQNSISNTNATPLYVVDGIPVNSRAIESNNSAALASRGFDPLGLINPANIESIEVLKDADGTAIYGSRGANGVILITTKRGGRSEKTNVDINYYAGAGTQPRFLELLNTEQYVTIRREAAINSNTPLTKEYVPDLVLWDTTRYTDWQKLLLGGSAAISDLQASISGGNRFTNFRFGAGYHKEGMTIPAEFGFRRVTTHFSLNHTSLSQKFKTGVTINYGITSNKIFTDGSLVNTALTLAPNAPALYDEAGNLNWENSTFNNPLAALRKTDDNKGSNFILNTNLQYDLLPGLTVRLNLGYNSLYQDAFVKLDPFSAMNPARINSNTVATSNFGLTKRSSWIAEPQLHYNKKFGEHEVNILAGCTWQESKAAYQLVEATGYSSDVLLESLRGATKTTYLRDDDVQYRYMAVFGRIGYNYQHKYILNFTGRRDGSSRFGPGHRWGNFGAVGAAWIFSAEKFMHRVSFLSFGKLRASYGVTGSDQVGDNKYISTYRYQPYTYEGVVSLVPSGLANAEYAWEQTWKLEAALELGFLHDRIHLQVAAYRNRCSNQLLDYLLPGSSGFSGVTQNLNATVENKGLELLITTINLNFPSFHWHSSLNFTLPKNKLISYPGLEESAFANYYVEGQPLSIQKLYNYQGVNPTTGLHEVKDIDGNGIGDDDYDENDRTYIQNTGRIFYGGLNNTVRFKDFELSVLFQFSRQTSYNLIFYPPGWSSSNLPRDVFANRWLKPGDLVKYEKSSRNWDAYYASSRANASNAAYLSSSFARLKTLSLSYLIPVSLLRKASLKSGKIFLQGQNLATISPFHGLDPEIGINTLPPLRIITGGVELQL